MLQRPCSGNRSIGWISSSMFTVMSAKSESSGFGTNCDWKRRQKLSLFKIQSRRLWLRDEQVWALSLPILATNRCSPYVETLCWRRFKNCPIPRMLKALLPGPYEIIWERCLMVKIQCFRLISIGSVEGAMGNIIGAQRVNNILQKNWRYLSVF